MTCGHTPQEHAQQVRDLMLSRYPAEAQALEDAVATAITVEELEG
jgi:hypothetical protein